MNAPCAGQWELFDSTDLADHMEAAQLCDGCPMRRQCSQIFEDLMAYCHPRARPSGTWAGQLIGHDGRPLTSHRIADKTRLLAEENAYSDEDAKKAHAAYWCGARDDWTTTGERVYQRRACRRQRANRKAAA